MTAVFLVRQTMDKWETTGDPSEQHLILPTAVAELDPDTSTVSVFATLDDGTRLSVRSSIVGELSEIDVGVVRKNVEVSGRYKLMGFRSTTSNSFDGIGLGWVAGTGVLGKGAGFRCDVPMPRISFSGTIVPPADAATDLLRLIGYALLFRITSMRWRSDYLCSVDCERDRLPCSSEQMSIIVVIAIAAMYRVQYIVRHGLYVIGD